MQVVGNGGLDVVDGIDDVDDAVVVLVSTTPLLVIDELEEFRDGGSGGLSPFDAPCVLPFCSSNVGILLLLCSKLVLRRPQYRFQLII